MSIREFLKRIAYKLTSSKLWITIWAMAMVTYMTKNNLLDNPVVYMLASVPIAYCGLNVLQKNKEQ